MPSVRHRRHSKNDSIEVPTIPAEAKVRCQFRPAEWAATDPKK